MADISDVSPTSHPSPERLILIASSRTMGPASRQLAAGASASGPGPRVVGAVLTDTPTGPVELAAPLLGALDDLPLIARNTRIDRAVVCLPIAMTDVIAQARRCVEDLGIPCVFMPTSEDVLRGACGSLVGTPLSPSADDLAFLVGRPPRPIDRSLVENVITGNRVLITGAGGSIGTELARLAASFDPSELMLMDRSDNALFEIDRQLGAAFPKVRRRVVLNDVADAEGTLRCLVRLRPQVVFHAAAHKHVPLMEDHPAAAVVNNFFGTRSVADAALAVDAERFVMISTDKAVNPTSVMGATKRLAEIYIRSLNHHRQTRFSLVRFGNVLGSACSVLPIWAKQVAEGGPITITHRDMTRFFMTIPEAAALVVQSAAVGGTAGHRAPDVFVLDMGEPVRIVDLAERFLRTLGLRGDFGDGAAGGTGPTIPIRVTGTRPGEKLYEELSYESESLTETAVPGVLAWRGPTPLPEDVHRMVTDLSRIRSSPDAEAVLAVLRHHVPELGANGGSPSVRIMPTIIQTSAESSAA
jgi:FlaA1/EpsC-like NDP-sugar epimerase